MLQNIKNRFTRPVTGGRVIVQGGIFNVRPLYFPAIIRIKKGVSP